MPSRSWYSSAGMSLYMLSLGTLAAFSATVLPVPAAIASLRRVRSPHWPCRSFWRRC